MTKKDMTILIARAIKKAHAKAILDYKNTPGEIHMNYWDQLAAATLEISEKYGMKYKTNKLGQTSGRELE